MQDFNGDTPDEPGSLEFWNSPGNGWDPKVKNSPDNGCNPISLYKSVVVSLRWI